MKRFYQAVAGDAFDVAALVIWGDEQYAGALMQANPLLCGKAVFTGGERLAIPEIALPASDTAAGYTSQRAPWKEE